MLTVADLLAEVRHASGAQNSLPGISDLSLVKQALQYFNSMHSWRTMIRAETSLSLVAGEDYLTLPEDYRDSAVIGYNQGIVNWFRWTDIARLTELRAADDDDQDYSGGYWGAMEYRTPATGGRPIQAISLYPQPVSSATDVFLLRYTAKLVAPGTGEQADTTYLQVIDELEPLLRRLTRIYAEAYYHRDGADLEHRLQALEQSEFLNRMKDLDGAGQTDLGELEGGAAQRAEIDTGWWDSAVNNPA